MKRFAHRLTPNTATTRPESMILFDTETVPHQVDDTFTRQDFHLGVACYWRHRRDGAPDKREWLEFKTISAFWGWTLSKARNNSTLYLVAHNIGFDAMVVQTFIEMPARGWKLVFRFEKGHSRLFRWGYPTKALTSFLAQGKPIVEFTGKRWARTLLMMDDCNIFNAPLEAWGQDLGFPKLTMPAYSAPDSEWWPYCRRDVEIMVRLWEEWFAFLDEHNLGTFRSTAASQAFSGFRHGYMNSTIEIHDNQGAIDLEREAFYGARTEAFWVGRQQGEALYKLDVNGMYAYVMQQFWYPSRLHAIGTHLSIQGATKLLAHYGMIATVKLDVTEPVFPIKQEGKNIYPIGQFTTTLTTLELLYALERDWVREIGRYATYRMRPIFHWYVEYFNALKVRYNQSGDKLRRSLVKLLLNAVYGKFGQAGYVDRIIGTADPALVDVSYGLNTRTHKRFTIYTAGGLVIEQTRSGEAFNSFVAIPAHVAAYARLYLWSLIEKAGRDHVFYVDTDGLIVDQVGYDALASLLDPDRLGMLKVEKIAHSMMIRAPKDYSLDDVKTQKGVTPGAIELEPDVFEIETWPSILTHLASGKLDTFYNRNVVKHLTYTIDWGNLQDDGWVTPYHFGITPLNF